MWYRVFGTKEVQIDPEELLSRLRETGCTITGSFHGDDDGWYTGEFIGAGSTPIGVQRFLVSEEGIRAELNAWAAYLETCDYNPNFARLMEHMIGTKQLFTIRRPDDAADDHASEKVCLALARYLARTTDGVYQVDQQGFFSPDGVLLLQES